MRRSLITLQQRKWCVSLATASLLWVVAGLAACGGGGGGASGTAGEGTALSLAAGAGSGAANQQAALAVAGEGLALTTRDAVRLADQASFGASEALIAAIRNQGLAPWISSQMALSNSHYAGGGGPDVHQNVSPVAYCDLPAKAGPDCWRENLSSQPLVRDFYRNAVLQPDQLRQRVAYALQQLLVVSGVELQGTYGLRAYYNMLLDNAFGSYRQVLKKLVLSPVMGDYLNNVNNHKSAPNENFARELLQLFTIGPCALELDGSMKSGSCSPAYNNDTVRAYAYALTGWTYPSGGAAAGGCGPAGVQCRFYNGDMQPLASFHDAAPQTLLSGVTLAAGHTPELALAGVLDSLMAHPNLAPFISRHLIQQLVLSNPSRAYVGRVAAAFGRGQFNSGGSSFGTNTPGDLAATVAAVLLDPEARAAVVARSAGKLREPVLLFTGALRALNGQTDGDALGWWWGGSLRQHVFRPPSVFNFYSPDQPVPGTTLVGPGFGIHNANAALQRLNYLVYLLDVRGTPPDPGVPNALGTRVDLDAFLADAADAAMLVDRLSLIALGEPLPSAARAEVIKAASWWTAQTDAGDWRARRVRTAAYLVFASPNYQVQR